MKTMPVPPDVWRTAAQYSSDIAKTYRYTLGRVWAKDRTAPLHRAVFVGLNPSTATEEFDDPTVRKCCTLARKAGMGGMTMLNLFALRSTDPKHMLAHRAPIGTRNDQFIRNELQHPTTKLIVVCWGNHGLHMGRHAAFLREHHAVHRLVCLGVNNNGTPKHPLYLSHNTPFQEFRYE